MKKRSYYKEYPEGYFNSHTDGEVSWTRRGLLSDRKQGQDVPDRLIEQVEGEMIKRGMRIAGGVKGE